MIPGEEKEVLVMEVKATKERVGDEVAGKVLSQLTSFVSWQDWKPWLKDRGLAGTSISSGACALLRVVHVPWGYTNVWLLHAPLPLMVQGVMHVTQHVIGNMQVWIWQGLVWPKVINKCFQRDALWILLLKMCYSGACMTF